MPLYRESNFLVVHPGSQETLFSFGLQESLSPPRYKISSVVYQDPSTKEYKSSKTSSDQKEIYPIQKSRIVDIDAFNFLLRTVLGKVIEDNPLVTINQIPLLLVVPSLTWTRSQIEQITKYVIESLEFTAFNIFDSSLATTFGMNTLNCACVIDVGREATQIVPLVGSQKIKFAGRYLKDIGSQVLNKELKKSLPDFSEKQIEALKTSGIFEFITSQENTFYSISDLLNVEKNEESDEFDVAKVVSSNNGAVGDKEGTEGENDEENEHKENSQLEKNYFLDPDTKEKIYVGKERFQVSSELIDVVSDAVHLSLSRIPDLARRQECYDNLIFVGSTFKIPGLKQALLLKLSSDYLIKPSSEANAEAQNAGVNSTILAYQQADDNLEIGEDINMGFYQVPSSIRPAKHPDYFPEWKQPKNQGGSWEHVYILGAEIYAKQIFTGNSNHAELYIDSDIYHDRGAQGIWDVTI